MEMSAALIRRVFIAVFGNMEVTLSLYRDIQADEWACLDCHLWEG